MIRSVLPLLVVFAAVSAQAQTAESPAEATAPAQHDPTEAAKAAADAARSAAQAAQASADALARAVDALERQKAPGADAAPAAAPAAPKPSAWNYQLGVSFLSVSGNANALTGKLSGQAEGTFGKWSTKVVAGGTYGQSKTQGDGESQITALNANASAKGARAVSDMFNLYLLGGSMMDRVASIAVQGYGEAGAGLVWFNNVEGDFVKSKLTTDLGFRYTREVRETYYPEYADLPDISIWALAVKGSFRYALSRTAVFTEEIEILPDVVNTRNLRATSTSTLSAQIDNGIALSLGFKIRYVGDPAEGAVPTDTELSAGVTWTF